MACNPVASSYHLIPNPQSGEVYQEGDADLHRRTPRQRTHRSVEGSPRLQEHLAMWYITYFFLSVIL